MNTEHLTTEHHDRVHLLGLGPAQILGGALAAVTAALAASFLGVAGTLIGAAVGSIVSTIGGALYAHSIQTAHLTLRETRLRLDRGEATAEVSRTSARWPGWRTLIAVAGVFFVVAVAAITVTEIVLGHPVSNASKSGTTLSSVGGGDSQPSRSRPSTAPSTAPSATDTGAASAPATVSPDATSTPSIAADPLSSIAPSGAVTPSASVAPSPDSGAPSPSFPNLAVSTPTP